MALRLVLLHLQLCALVRRRLGRGRPLTVRHEIPSFRQIDEKERSPIERERDAGLNPKQSGFESDRYLGGDIAKRDRNLWTKDLDGKRCGSRGCRPEPTDVEAEADTYRRSQARKAAKKRRRGRKEKERACIVLLGTRRTAPRCHRHGQRKQERLPRFLPPGGGILVLGRCRCWRVFVRMR